MFLILYLGSRVNTIVRKPTFSTDEYSLKSNAIKLEMDLVIRFALSEFDRHLAGTCNRSLLLSQLRWFLKLVVLPKNLS